MASVCRICRQIGEKLYLKGARCRTAKCALERRSTTPGQHGVKIGTKKVSNYGKQLREKQKVKFMYGMREAQFRRFFENAVKMGGVTGENLLSLLERRLDNVVYRIKLAFSRGQARQMVVHGMISVNGRKVTSPSYIVSVGDVVSLTERAMKNATFLEAIVDKRLGMSVKVPEWLELDKANRSARVIRLPERMDIPGKVEEHLIVELYSK